MPTSITGTGVTFNDATSQTSKASTLGPIQYGGVFSTQGVAGRTTYTNDWTARGNEGVAGLSYDAPDSQTTVRCGWQAYLGYTFNAANAFGNTRNAYGGSSDGAVTAGGDDSIVIYIRLVYRSIS
jgi:hypothetical protein